MILARDVEAGSGVREAGPAVREAEPTEWEAGSATVVAQEVEEAVQGRLGAGPPPAGRFLVCWSVLSDINSVALNMSRERTTSTVGQGGRVTMSCQDGAKKVVERC
ncbi:hypothetical protein Bbelb_050540 [Branchiostoma belcheri]|nr:hypothetical protein Bbelb_050540 [Branchiostoma belcheri]